MNVVNELFIESIKECYTEFCFLGSPIVTTAQLDKLHRMGSCASSSELLKWGKKKSDKQINILRNQLFSGYTV